MYKSYLEWGSPELSSFSLSYYDELHDFSVNHVYGVNHHNDLRMVVGGVEDDIWVGVNLNEGLTNSSCLLESLASQEDNRHEYSLISNNFNLNKSKDYIHINFERQTKCIPTKNQDSLVSDDSVPNINLIDFESFSSSSTVSHSSLLNGILLVPNDNSVNNIRNERIGIEACSQKFESKVHRKSERGYIKNIFSEQRQSNIIDRARSRTEEKLAVNTSHRYKYDGEFSMLVASGGAPLGKIEGIPGIEWHPEKKSWKVTGYTGISWCVRRKTWRVWFVTSNGTRATRSFNPKEHGTVAAALKSAIEFLEQKRAERSQIKKKINSRIKRTFTD
ncbi:hypothetical protein RS030_192978 [Cryptosporidium xiaoi]|uniref:AP2/ERF domain-containing protein n=1 Tax=Cryptosporidium xiaoi TaxID=659607 RepID=A0AAV9XZH0_9CRYT